jgi:hypothetical protein
MFLLYLSATYTHVPTVPVCYLYTCFYCTWLLLYQTATVPVCYLYTCSYCTCLLLIHMFLPYLSATYTYVPTVPDCYSYICSYWYACSQCKWLLTVYMLLQYLTGTNLCDPTAFCCRPAPEQTVHNAHLTATNYSQYCTLFVHYRLSE